MASASYRSSNLLDDDFVNALQNQSNDEEEVEPQELLQRLQKMWNNEMFAPDLLLHQQSLVECCIELISGMEMNFQNAKSHKQIDFLLATHKMEVERIRFMVTSYLRCRLEKIEKFVFRILEDDSQRIRGKLEPLMTPDERDFAQKYRLSIENYLKTAALEHMPAQLQQLDLAKIGDRPNLDHYVFIKVNKHCDGILIPDPVDETREELLDLDEGTQHILPYKPIAECLADGSVDLL